MIPKIIHQSWKTEDVPDVWRTYQSSWRALNPAYTYRLWTNDDNRRLVAEHFPELLAIYDGYPLDINRADLARYLVLWREGGVYADLDVECLRPFDDLLAGHRLVFGVEPDTHAHPALLAPRGLDRIVCNAIMASAPRHAFWKVLLDLVPDTAAAEQVLDATGPLLLTRACDAYEAKADMTILPASAFYPLDQEATRSLSAAAIHKRAGDAFAIHYWQGTWKREEILSLARRRVARRRHA